MNRRLIIGLVTFTMVALICLEVPFGLTLTNDTRNTHIEAVVNDAATLSYLVETSAAKGTVDSARPLLHQYAASTHDVVVIAVLGRAVLSVGVGAAEELRDPAIEDIIAAATRGRVSGEEGSHDPDDDYLYAASPVVLHTPSDDDRTTNVVHGVLLIASSAASMHEAIRRDVERLVVIGLVLLAVAAAAGVLFARSLTRPLAAIETAVIAHGRGDLAARAPTDTGPPELRAHAESVNDMAARLDELLDTQRTFIADAAHQLRSPLTALRLRLENLSVRHHELSADGLASSLAEADRLSQVIDGLLVLARADGARPAREVVDVAAVLADRADAWAALAAERGVTLTNEWGRTGDTAVLVMACRGFIDQVIDNLLANALDATPAGGSIRMTLDPLRDSVDVHVIDSGVGMTADERARAFDRFWRGLTPRGEGTGLGLTIVTRLVRVCGGTCRLDEAPGGGVDAVATFRAARPHHTPAPSVDSLDTKFR